jgi:sensor domain CHASE-containing protein
MGKIMKTHDEEIRQHCLNLIKQTESKIENQVKTDITLLIKLLDEYLDTLKNA